ncbi:MAG TPA: hypothetical protein VIF64_01790 [Pyrinomonadaceae bacterium]|jgi:hypothetical protein
MKPFKAFCAAALIALSLSIPAYAEDPPPGDGHETGNPIGIPLPPPPKPVPDTPVPNDGSAPNDSSTITLMDILMALAKIF